LPCIIKEGIAMGSFQDSVNEYQKQLGKGVIKEAYKGLMEYMMGLRTHFEKEYPDYLVSGSIYFGYMDMTYFSIIPEFFKQRKLKIAVVLLHEKMRFEVWLAGYNKLFQSSYWKLIKEAGWNKYCIVTTTKGVDSIIEHVLVDRPDFNELDSLTTQIEIGILNFIKGVSDFLSEQNN
jgi:hypothetical protein